MARDYPADGDSNGSHTRGKHEPRRLRRYERRRRRSAAVRDELLGFGLGTLIHQVERFGVALENRGCQLLDLLVGGVWRYRRHLRVAANIQNGGSVCGQRAIPGGADVVVAVYGNAGNAHGVGHLSV